MITVVRNMMLRLLVAVVVIVLLLGPATSVRADEHEDEAAVGQSVYDDLRAKLLIVDESPYVPVLRRVGARVAKAAEPHWFNARFYVVKGNDINAFSAPGGFVFVSEGLMRAVDNSDELANVLGHETAHLVLSHVHGKTQQATGTGLLLAAGNVAVKKASKGTVSAYNVAALVGGYSFLNYTRQQEYAADEFGVKLAAKASYNPWGTVWFLEHIERLVGDAGFEAYVQQHPSTADRIDKVQRFLQDNASDYARWQNRRPPGTNILSGG